MYISQLSRIIGKKNIFTMVLVSTVISFMEFLSVFSIYPVFYFLENKSQVDNVHYESILDFIKTILSIGTFEAIVLASIFVILATNLIIYARLVAISRIKESILHNNREGVLLMLADTNLTNSSGINDSNIKSYLTIESERVAQVVISFTNIVTALLVVLFFASYLIYISYWLIIVLLAVVSILFLILNKSYKNIKNLGDKLSAISNKYIAYIDNILHDKAFFMLSEKSLVKRSFNVDVIKDIHLYKYINQKKSAFNEFFVRTATMIIILVVIYIFFMINTEISLILFVGVLFVRLVPFFSQLNNSFQNLKANYPAINGYINIENSLSKASSINLNDIHLSSIKIKCKACLFQNINIENDYAILNKGELHGVFGDSGSGKTLFVLALLGLSKHKNASFYLNDDTTISDRLDVNVLKNSFYMNQNIIPCEFSLLDMFKNTNKDQVDRLFDKFGFDTGNENLFSRKISTFSGGERQRISLIYALLNKRKVMVFDEPTSALDKKMALIAFEEIRELVEKNNIIGIIISHENFIKEKVQRYIEL